MQIWINLLLILFTTLNGCKTVRYMKKIKPLEIEKRYTWLYPQNKEHTKAIVVVVHGLNLKPEKMDGWANALVDNNALVARVSLFGHGANKNEMAQVDAGVWRHQFQYTMEEINKEAQKLNVPVYFLGFSLGALVGLHWMSYSSNAAFDKMVLIAPAIATAFYAKPVVAFLSKFSKNLVIPSRSAFHYRANKAGTSIRAYEALFDLKKSLAKSNYRNLNIDTMVLIDRHDELVPAKKIKKIIEKYKLGRWKFLMVNNQFAHDTYGMRHLMIDEDAVGNELWNEMKTKVLMHFGL